VAHRVSQQLASRRRGVPIAVAIGLLLLSSAANFAVVGGAVTLLENEPWEPKREQLMIVELTDADLPTPKEKEEKEEPEPEKPEKEPEKEPDWEIVEPEPEPEPEPEEEPEPEPEPEPESEPEPEPEPPPQEIEPLDAAMKMVEQLDENDDNETNENADYLSNIDRKVAEQNRADITNLQKDAREAEASQVQPDNSPERGTSSEDIIAETKTQRSAKNRQAPDVRPEKEDLRPEQDDPKPESLLATRELAPRDHSQAMEAREDLAVEAEDGFLEAAQLEAASVLERNQQAKIMRRDPRYAFKLSQREMDALFGEDQNAPKNVESQQLSEKKGVWDDARKAYQSPLENMVPEVQVGNQTALNSRKHPFARYIATVHRGIHDGWAFGYLAMLESHPNSHPLNDYNLWTRVEIVLNGDGTIDKVRTVHRSGNSSFDAAAREVVLAAGPFPDPPKEIRSGNGKIYIHWAFHRNERACGTFGANPYILDNAGGGDIPDAHAEIHLHGGGGHHEEGARPLRRNEGGNVVGSAGEHEVERLRRGGQGSGLSPVPEGPSRPPPKPADPQPGEGATATAPPGFGRGGGGSGGGGGGGSGGGGSGRGGAIPGTGGMPVGPDGVPIGRNSGSGGSGGSGGGGGSSGGGSGSAGSGSGGSGSSSGKSGSGLSLSGRRSSTSSSGGGAANSEPAEGPKEPDGEVDPAATAIAKNWVRAFTKGELTTVINRSALPFRYQSRIAAKSKEELEGLLESLSDEVAGQTATVKGTYTAAGLRKKYGSVAAGVEEGEGRVYAVVEIAGDTVILMLEQRFGSWRVVGMTR
jgi:TonB family protein